MSTATKKWVKLSVILYVVILLFVSVATFAWFLFNDTATLQTKENMQITAGNKLEILLVDDAGNALVNDWASNIGVTTPTRVFPDITGDGTNFYFPQSLIDDEPASMDYDEFIDIGQLDAADRNVYYITVNVQFRTTIPMDIYLAEGSYIKAENEVADDENKSILGNFSRDYIAAASRVSFSEKDGSEITLKNVWIPNDTYQLQYDSANRDNVTGFITDGEREKFKYLTKTGETMSEYEYTPSNYADRMVTLGSQQLASTTNAVIHESACLLSFDANDVANGVAVKTMVIRIWIEGTDREAHMALSEGDMNYKFQFVGIHKKDRDENYADGITIVDSSKLYKNGTEVESGKWEYSTNGIDWKTYNNSLGEALAPGANIFVRSAEAEGYKASTAVIVRNQ